MFSILNSSFISALLKGVFAKMKGGIGLINTPFRFSQTLPLKDIVVYTKIDLLISYLYVTHRLHRLLIQSTWIG